MSQNEPSENIKTTFFSDYFISFIAGMIFSAFTIVACIGISFFISELSIYAGHWAAIASVVVFFILLSYFFSKGMKAFVLGMISTILIPLLLFGSCMIALSNGTLKF